MGPLRPDDIYRSLRENQRCLDDIPSDQPAARPALSDYARKFEELCNSVMIEDTFILDRMERRDVFQYERIVLDREYFRACFERLAEGCRHAIANSDAARLDPSWEGFPSAVRLECTQAYLDTVFAMGPANEKRSGKRSVEDIFAIWPDLFKAIFVQHLERQGGRDAVDRYAEYGYELPGEVHPSAVTGSRASFANSGLAVSGPGVALTRDGSSSGAVADALPERLAEATLGSASGLRPLLCHHRYRTSRSRRSDARAARYLCCRARRVRRPDQRAREDSGQRAGRLWRSNRRPEGNVRCGAPGGRGPHPRARSDAQSRAPRVCCPDQRA